MKAETRLLADVSMALRSVAISGQKPTMQLKSLQAKEDLLHVLIESELGRLTVWLHPLNEPRDLGVQIQGSKGPAEVSLKS